MNILFIFPEDPTEFRNSGVATHYLWSAEYLVKLGHKVDIFCPASDGRFSVKKTRGRFNLYRLSIIKKEAVLCHKVINFVYLNFIRRLFQKLIPEGFQRVEWNWLVYKKFLELNKIETFDIIESSEWGSGSFFISLLSRSSPVIIRLYRSTLTYIIDNNLPIDLDHRIIDFLEKRAVLMAKAITAPTGFILKYALENWIKNDFKRQKILFSLIRDGVPALRKDIFKRQEILGKYLLFIGRLEKAKGVLTLVKAFLIISEKWPHLKLFLVGRDTKTFFCKGKRIYFKDYIRKNKLMSDKIFFLGQINNRKKIFNYIQKSLICIIPSEGNENFPYTLLEAMSFGKPVIVSSAGGLSEVIKDRETGLIFTEKRVGLLASKISLLLMNEKLRKKVGRNAHKESKSRFSLAKTAQDTLNFYKKVLRSKRFSQ